MTPLTAATTIELPHGIPVYADDGRRIGVDHRYVTFAVCIVDGERCGPDDESKCIQPECFKFDPMRNCPCVPLGPPAWLTELTEDCKTCGGEQIVDTRWDPNDGHMVGSPCPDCFDGRPAVEVQELAAEITAGPLAGTVAYDLLGRGTVEHVLPVVDVATYGIDGWYVVIDHAGVPWLWMGDRYHEEPLDIDVIPGQYVALIRMEES